MAVDVAVVAVVAVVATEVFVLEVEATVGSASDEHALRKRAAQAKTTGAVEQK